MRVGTTRCGAATEETAATAGSVTTSIPTVTAVTVAPGSPATTAWSFQMESRAEQAASRATAVPAPAARVASGAPVGLEAR
jgi:hypothetical protein